jgi:hypothetical protein
MRNLGVVWLFLGLVAAGPAGAVICATDDVPAATLLLPYFEQDLNQQNAKQTLFSINNASATAVLAHVVIWSDLSVPVLDFNIYLTGYDIQTINLWNILHNGILPQTASVGQDPDDTISPQGLFSQDINFASCNGQLPPPPLPPEFIQHLQLSLTGKPSPILLDQCAGRDLGDNVARGYITVDTVSNCTLRFQGDPGYFAPGGTGDATDQNVLWGDYFYDDGDNIAQGETLVHIEASPTNPETSIAGQYTFYGRYVNWTAADNREPLATNFAVRFVNGGNGGPFSSGTHLVVWRDSKVNQAAFDCPALAGARPSWFPLGVEGIVIFDEEENPQTTTTVPVSPPPPQQNLNPFPAEAQSVQVDSAALPVPFDFGWLYLDLNTSVAAAGNNPPEDPQAAQAWVSALMDAEGRFGVGFDAVRLDSACRAVHSVPHP